jgi:hypothetical protein
MKFLAKNGFDSAFKISYTPRNYFLKQIRDIPGGIEKAKEIRVNAVAYNLKTTSQRKCIRGALPT